MTTKQRREFWIADKDLGDDKVLTKGTYLCSTNKPDKKLYESQKDSFIYSIEITNEEAVYNKADVEALVEALKYYQAEYSNDYGYDALVANEALERWEGK